MTTPSTRDAAGSPCPRCGAAADSSVAEGLCVHCLMHTAAALTGAIPAEAGEEAFPLPFGEYDLLAELGRGGAGRVYRARHRQLHRTVALKMLIGGEFGSPDFLRRFRTEGLAAASLDHPNIVPVYDVGVQDGQPFLTMRLVEGGSLAARLAADRKALAQPRAAAAFIGTLARAVHAAHQRGVLHRDIKPGNILIGADGLPHLADFGLARLLESDSTLTRTHALLGTPSYMAPEQAQGAGPVSTAADVYGLGAVLYELLTGQPPFAGGTTFETVRQLLDTEVRPPSSLVRGLDRDVETICLKCLAKGPGERYGSAEALADDLDRYLRREPIAARRIGWPQRTWKWMHRRPLVSSLLSMLALGVLAAGLGGFALTLRVAREARRAEAEAAASRERLVQLYRSNAVREMNQGNLFDSMNWCVEALRAEVGHPERAEPQRIRLAALLQSAPRLTGMWVAPPPAGPERTNEHHLHFVAGGRRLLFADSLGKGMRLIDVADPPGGGDRAIEDGGPDGFRWRKFSAGGEYLALGGESVPLRLWRLETGEEVALAPEVAAGVVLAEPGRDGSLVTADAGGVVRVWSRDGVLVHSFPGGGRPADVGFSPDGRSAFGLYPGAAPRLWRLSDGGLVALEDQAASPSRNTRGVFSADSSQLMVITGDSVRVWNAAAEMEPAGLRLPTVLMHPSQWWIHHGALSPDGARVATGARDATARLWDVRHPDTPAVVLQHQHRVLFTGFSPDGQRVATASDDGAACVWDTATGQRTVPPLPHPGAAGMVHFSPDGRRLAVSGSRVGRLWELADTELAVDPFVDTGATACAFSSDGTRLITVDAFGAPRVWDWASGLEEFGPPPPGRLPSPFVQGGAFPPVSSPDGRHRLVVEGNTVRIREASGAGTAAAPMRHREAVTHAAWSGDGRCIVTCSIMKAARVWDAATGDPLTPEWEHPSRVLYAAFSPDRRHVATLCVDRRVRIWRLPVEDRPVEVLDRLVRLITCREVAPGGALVEADDIGALEGLWKSHSQDQTGTFSVTEAARARWHLRELELTNAAPSAAMLDVHLGDTARRPLRGPFLAGIGEPEAALPELDWALARAPENTTLREARARAHAALGHWPEAIADYQGALARHPRQARWLHALGLCQMKERQWEEAHRSMAQASALQPAIAFLHFDAAEAAAGARLWTEARQASASGARLIQPPGLAMPPPPADLTPAQIDLSRVFNALPEQNWLATRTPQRPCLPDVPRGRVTFGGIAFDVRGVVQLSDSMEARAGSPLPAKVTVPVGRPCRAVHLLHACPRPLAAGTRIGHVTLWPAEGAPVEHALVYGRNVVHWAEPSAVPEDAGTEEVFRTGGAEPQRLFRTTWAVPEPGGEIAMISLSSAMRAAGPCILAITLE